MIKGGHSEGDVLIGLIDKRVLIKGDICTRFTDKLVIDTGSQRRAYRK